MNLMIESNDFNLENIHFLEEKPNIVMDGKFTKLIYSNHCMTLNGVYLYFPVDFIKIDKIMNKNVLYFDAVKHKTLIKLFAKIEQQILEYYLFLISANSKTTNNKQTILKLESQLNSGSIKIYTTEQQMKDLSKTKVILKISGVWETYNKVGLTFRAMRVFTP
jgi:cell division protein FtsL